MPDQEPNIVNIQESKAQKLTREYNQFLTKNENLENNPTVSIDEYVTNNGKKIKRYNLAGTDFAFFSHTVGIGINNNNLEISNIISKEINHWDAKKKGEANNQISCSLITHDHIAHAGYTSTTQVLLAFNQIENGNLLLARAGDIGTNVDKNKIITDMDEINTYPPQDILKTQNYGSMYNEVVISRYQGEKARKPDFIIVFDGKINQRIEQALDYFQIPIINFQTNTYVENINQQIIQTIVDTKKAQTLEEQKKMFSEISYLSSNKTNWITTRKELVYNEPIEKYIKQEIFELEKSIVNKQLNQDNQTAKETSEKFATQSDLKSLQEIRNLMYELAQNTYSSLLEQAPVNFLSGDYELIAKWHRGSHEILSQTLIGNTPNIIKIYRQQTDLIISKVNEITSQEIDEKIQEFWECATVSKHENTGEFLLSKDNYFRHEIVSDSMNTQVEKFQHPELIDPLFQIWSAQEKLKNTLLQCRDKIKQRERQQQIDQQISLLETASNNTEEMVSLLKENPMIENFNFKEIVFKKIEDHLMDPNRKNSEILQDFRNYDVVRYNLFQKYLDSINNQYTQKIFRLLINPNEITQIPQKIQTSDIITSPEREEEKFKFAIFTDSDGQRSIFEINQYWPQKLNKLDDKSVEILDKINKKWFWRLRQRLSKFNQSETYQYTTYMGDKTLLAQSKKDWYLINESSVQKINMANFNIETGEEVQR